MSLRPPILLALLHMTVVSIHDVAHAQLNVFDGPLATLYVAVCIHFLPFLGSLLLMRGRVRSGLGALFLGLFATLVYATVSHYVLRSHDHVDYLPPGNAQALFRASAAALNVVDAVGLAALVVWTRRLLIPAGRHVLLVDGTCIACHRFVMFALSCDKKGELYFAHLQNNYGQSVLIRHGAAPADVDGVYLLLAEGTPEEQLLRDGELGRQLWPMLIPFLTPLLFVPAPALDPLYKAFSRIRYRTFGQFGRCHVPTPAERARFITDAPLP